MHKKYRVAVYNNHGGTRFHTNRPLAYLRYFTFNACIHEVRAENGTKAKQEAIRQHQYNGNHMCSHKDPYCENCPGVGARL